MAITNTHSTDLEASSAQSWSIADASQTGLDFTTTFTVGAWVKFESTPVGVRSIACKGQADTSQLSWWVFWDGSNISIDLTSDGSTEVVTSWATTINTGTWYHIAIAYNGGNAAGSRLEAYKDGTSLGDGSTSVASVHSGSGSFIIGNAGGSNREMDGLVDDVFVCNTRLSDANISDYYADPCDYAFGAELQGRWLFNNDGLDETANNNDLTNNNTATFSTTLAYTCSVDYPLTAALGTFTLTGVSAILTSTRSMVAALGTFTLTGLAAAVGKGFVMLGALGTFTLTGVDSAITSTRTLVAALGTYTLTGIAATFLRTSRIIASLGTFVLTFIDASITRKNWVKENKNTSAFSNTNKNTSDTWSDIIKE